MKKEENFFLTKGGVIYSVEGVETIQDRVSYAVSTFEGTLDFLEVIKRTSKLEDMLEVGDLVELSREIEEDNILKVHTDVNEEYGDILVAIWKRRDKDTLKRYQA